MRFAECECSVCGTFKITFDNNIPKQKHMFCPCCGLYSDVVRIDRK